MASLLDRPVFFTEAQTARILGIDRSTLHRLAHAGKAPVEPVWITQHVRRYRVRDVERLAGISDEEAAA